MSNSVWYARDHIKALTNIHRLNSLILLRACLADRTRNIVVLLGPRDPLSAVARPSAVVLRPMLTSAQSCDRSTACSPPWFGEFMGTLRAHFAWRWSCRRSAAAKIQGRKFGLDGDHRRLGLRGYVRSFHRHRLRQSRSAHQSRDYARGRDQVWRLFALPPFFLAQTCGRDCRRRLRLDALFSPLARNCRNPPRSSRCSALRPRFGILPANFLSEVIGTFVSGVCRGRHFFEGLSSLGLRRVLVPCWLEAAWFGASVFPWRHHRLCH